MTSSKRNKVNILGNEKNPILKVTHYIKSINTRALFVTPGFLGMILSVVWLQLAPKIGVPTNIYVMGIFSFFMMGLGGVGIIIKREFPATAFSSTQGLPAIVIGSLWILFWWGLAFAGIWRIFWK
jgi:predicted small integral membrane protein